jgi:hypothetical protein
VGLGLLHGFITADFSGVGSLAPCPTPNLEDQLIMVTYGDMMAESQNSGMKWQLLLSYNAVNIFLQQ